MAESAGSIQWDLDLDDKKFKSKLKDSKTDAEGFGSQVGGILGGVGKAALAFGAAAGTAFVGFSALSVKAASESQAALAQLDAVLKSTGGTAGVTRDAAIDLSKGLQRVTTFSDEAVLGAENLLLTFTNISKDKFPQATKTVLDMATALGEDTKDASIQLGKALQDPILGITALRRVGVNFNDAQKEVIKNLVESGKKEEAQALILKELQTEFGGSAEAATKTFGGALKQLGNSLNDLQETFGLAIINAITPFVKALASWATSRQGEQAIQTLIQLFKDFTMVVANIVTTVWPFLVQGFQTFLIILEVLRPAFDYLLQAFTPLIDAVLRFYEAVKPLLPFVGVALITALYAFVIGLGAVVRMVTGLINFISNLVQAIKNLLGAFGNFAGAIGNVMGGVYDAIVGPFKAAFKWVSDNVGKFGKAVGNLNPFKNFKIPGFASGVNNFSGGLAVVGERGPELVNLPGGSSVTPNNKLGDTFVINLEGVMASSRADLRRVGEDIISAIDEARRAKGKSTILG